MIILDINAEKLKKLNSSKANYVIKKVGEGLNYEEAICLAEESEQILDVTPARDPAFQFLLTSTRNYYELAWAFNWVNKTENLAHLRPVSVIASYNKGKVTEVTTVYIKKSFVAGFWMTIEKMETFAKAAYFEAAILRDIPARDIKDLEVALM